MFIVAENTGSVNIEYYSPGFDSYPQYSLLPHEAVPDLCMTVPGSVYLRHTWLCTCPTMSSQRMHHRLQENKAEMS